MDLPTFRTSLDEDTSPEGVGAALQALWYEAKGNWDRAHRLAQSQNDAMGAWVHAYLHRLEGNNANADYWYRRAARPRSAAPPRAEWDEIAAALLGDISRR